MGRVSVRMTRIAACPKRFGACRGRAMHATEHPSHAHERAMHAPMRFMPGPVRSWHAREGAVRASVRACDAESAVPVVPIPGGHRSPEGRETDADDGKRGRARVRACM